MSSHGPGCPPRIALAALIVWCTLAVRAQGAGPDDLIDSYGDVVPIQESAEMSTVHSAQPISYTHTLRITFAYDGPKLEIKRVQRVAMLAPAALSTSPAENQTGYWLEVRDREGAILYHRPMHDPLHRHIESFGDAPGTPMRRHPANTTKGEFDVLVPDLPGAQTFCLNGPSADTRAAAPSDSLSAPSGSLGEHSFDELRDLAQRDAVQGGAR